MSRRSSTRTLSPKNGWLQCDAIRHPAGPSTNLTPTSPNGVSRLTTWTIELHKDFYKDLDKLSKAELEIFHKKREKIKANPERQKHLAGGGHCYREPIGRDARLVYAIVGDRIWFLTVGRHEAAYDQYRRRLQELRAALE